MKYYNKHMRSCTIETILDYQLAKRGGWIWTRSGNRSWTWRNVIKLYFEEFFYTANSALCQNWAELAKKRPNWYGPSSLGPNCHVSF